MKANFIFTLAALKRSGVKKYITAILMLVSFSLSGQQNRSIYGIVFSKKNKKPLTGANIQIVKSNAQKKNILEAEQTLTNEQGLFNLTLPLEVSKIIVSLSGYKSLSLPLKKNKNYYTVYLDETGILKSSIISLNKVVIGKKLNTLNIISDIDIKTNPVNSSQDILRKVPGLFIGQHAGGGKAEQIFLRGFDADHGTDVAISVDDMPVNLFSHAHGQGYSDLHFVIPETSDKIDFGKGAYYANKGDFDNAGYVNFKTKTTLDNSQIKMEIGQFDTYRLSGLFNVLKENKHNAYVATEFINTNAQDYLTNKINNIEKKLEAKIGVSIFYEKNHKIWHYKGNDRFPLTSTFKTLACAAVLSRVDSGQERLERIVDIKKEDMVGYAPVTENFINKNMTISELCSAAMTWSDNSAGNLILHSIGGPRALTAYLRKIGDKETQLSRLEPDLNEAIPGDTRDTTTPNAITYDLHNLLFGNVLSEKSKKQLTQWLMGNKVADSLIRSIVPETWHVGDRTGAGGYGSRAITAIIWPPEKKPVIIVSIYITETNASFEARNRAIVEISKEILELNDFKN